MHQQLKLLRSEFWESLRLCVPLSVIQFCEAAISFVDILMMGWLGTQSLAAGGLGVIIFLTVLSVCMGLVEVVGAIAATAYNKDDYEQVSQITCMGLWLCLAVSLVAMLLLWQVDAVLPLLGQTEENAKLAGNYLHAILWSFPAALSFVVFKEIATVLGKPQLLITIALATIPLNAIANYCFAFGKLGLPTLGLAGLGWASTLISWLSLFSAVALFAFDKSFKDKHLFRYWREFKRSILNQILQLGWPLMAQLGAELILFSAVALLMGYWGTNMLAADEIVISVLDIAVVIPWGISYAVAIRVAQGIGQKNSADAFRAAIISFSLVFVFTAIVAFVFWFFPEQIVAFYLDVTIPENLEVFHFSTQFFKFAAIFQIFYGIHFVCIGALQGLLDSLLPMLINSVSYWLIGIGGGYILGEIWQLQGIGLWCCLILSVLIADILLIFRFIWLLLKNEKHNQSLAFLNSSLPES